MQKLWGRKMSDLSFGKFVTILEYVAKGKGKNINKVDRFFPSSKLCSACNHQNQDLSLKERSWICPSCNIVHDREENASKNILREGASSLGLDIVRLESSSRYCQRPESNRL